MRPGLGRARALLPAPTALQVPFFSYFFHLFFSFPFLFVFCLITEIPIRKNTNYFKVHLNQLIVKIKTPCLQHSFDSPFRQPLIGNTLDICSSTRTHRTFKQINVFIQFFFSVDAKSSLNQQFPAIECIWHILAKHSHFYFDQSHPIIYSQ